MTPAFSNFFENKEIARKNLAVKIIITNGHTGEQKEKEIYSAKQLFKLLKDLKEFCYIYGWHYRIYINQFDITIKLYENGNKQYFKENTEIKQLNYGQI